MQTGRSGDALSRVSSTVMGAAPLAPVAAGLVLGILLDYALWLSATTYLAIFIPSVLMLLMPRLRRRVGPLPLLIAAVATGGVWHLVQVRAVPGLSVERFAMDPPKLVRLRGRVADEPRLLVRKDSPFEPWMYGTDRTAFLFDVDQLEGVEGDIAATGRVRIVVDEAVLDLREGEPLEVFGTLYGARPPSNPGSFDWSAWRRRQGVVAGVRVNVRENIRRLHANPVPRPSMLTRVRNATHHALTDELATWAGEDTGLLGAMVLGHRSQLDRHLNDLFIQAGCVHFLAVSGVHVGIAMMCVLLLTRMCGASRRVQFWAMLVGVVAYVLLVEARPPILRAGVFGIFFCVACLLGRDRARLNWISATLIVLSVADPGMVLDIGYQLSSVAVLGVVYLSPAIKEACATARRSYETRLRGRPFGDEDRRLVGQLAWPTGRFGRFRQQTWRGFVEWIRAGLAVGVAAWVVTLPIVSTYFHQVHPWGSINSVLILPLVMMVMGLGFAKLLLGLAFPAVGALLAWPLAHADWLLVGLVDCLASLPGAMIVASAPPPWINILYYVFLVTFVWRFSASGRTTVPAVSPSLPMGVDSPMAKSNSRPMGVICMGSFVLLAIGVAGWQWPREPADRLVVTTLSVGSGSACVLELPDGQTMLYDAGSSRPYDVGGHTIVPFLQHRGIKRVDRVYLSHANLDHFSGILAVVDELPTGSIVINEYFVRRAGPTSPARQLLEELATRGQSVETIDPLAPSWTFGGATFEMLWPFGPADETLAANEASTVLRVSYAGRSILLTGDIENRGQRALMERGDLHADVLVLPHHGGVRSSTSAFIAAVGAETLIRSSGKRMAETRNGLVPIVRGMSLYNTADVGAVQITLDSDGMRVSSHNP